MVAADDNNCHSNAIVVDVDVGRTLCLPVKPDTKQAGTKNIVLHDGESDVELGDDDNQRCQECNKSKKDRPQNWWPVLHDVPIKDKLLHNTLIGMSELETKEEGSRPDKVVVVEDTVVIVWDVTV